MKKSNIRQRGDTIVEVMMAMSIMGMVLASAFSLANRNYATGISARERSEALEIVESQIELMNIASTIDGTDIFEPVGANELFCIITTTDPISRVVYAGTPGEIVDKNDPITDYDPQCQIGTSGRYNVSIEQDADDEKIYSVRVRWESILGGNVEELNHVYRITDIDSSFNIASVDDACSNIYYVKNGAGECIVSCTDVPIPKAVITNTLGNGSLGYARLSYTFSTSLPSGYESGVVFKSASNPTISDNSVPGSGTGTSKYGDIAYKELKIGTTFYFRAYTRHTETGCVTYSDNQYARTIPIPTGFKSMGIYQGSRYIISDDPLRWSGARAMSDVLGGNLVIITSSEENNFVRSTSAAYASGALVWIGLSDAKNEGSYEWVDGSRATYTNWASPVQPDNYTYNGSVPQGEDYMMIYTNDGRWNDLPDFYSLRYIVEFR